MTVVNEYEIELTFVRDGKTESATSTQWAYSLMEAVQQASFLTTDGASNMKILKAGPPRRLIDAACLDLAAHIAAITSKLGVKP